jgi:Na+-driven multidrug efflux pump
MGPELLLLLLGWSCTVIELDLQWQGAGAVTWSEPWVLVIGVLVVLMLVIWAGNTVRKFLFEGEFSSADLGSLFLVVASTSALFWAHHMLYGDEARQRGDFLPPFTILLGSILLQIIATWILLRPCFHPK